ncbi:MAG: hypothetical protein M0Z65_12425 [Firmicutes bacterium]|nr:hypothetical protein [Bacillota bacterium]
MMWKWEERVWDLNQFRGISLRYLWVIIAILIMTGCNATPSDQRKHATPCTNIRTAVKKFPKQVELPTELPFKVDEQSACLINWEGRDYISEPFADFKPLEQQGSSGIEKGLHPIMEKFSSDQTENP